MPATPPPKTCPSCGRTFAWRRKWARCWDQVRYCSSRCRHLKPRPGHPSTSTGSRLEHHILTLLATRQGSICPSEAARATDPDGWRQLMRHTRDAARRLAAHGVVRFLQQGQTVAPTTARGPVRLARGPAFPTASP